MIEYIKCARTDVGLGKRYNMERYCDKWSKIYESVYNSTLIVRI